MSKERRQMWVHPEFHKMMKSRSAENDLSLEDYTRMLSKDIHSMDELFKESNKKKKHQDEKFFNF